MKVIIAGSRDLTDYQQVLDAVRLSGFVITEVVSGCARGADELGQRWANDHSIPIKTFPADWGKFGKSAGPLRNEEMAQHAEALIALPSSTGQGTQDIIRRAKHWKRRVFIRYI